jgi:hypothetical protein
MDWMKKIFWATIVQFYCSYSCSFVDGELQPSHEGLALKECKEFLVLVFIKVIMSNSNV